MSGGATAAPVFEWVRHATSTDESLALGLAVDDVGNIVATGRYSGTANFSGTSFSSVGGADEIVTAKYDENGNLLWVRPVPGGGVGGGATNSHDVAIDAAGNVFVTGYYANTATFGSITLPAGGAGEEVFVAKYDPNGIVQWAQAVTSNQPIQAFGIGVDPSGNATIGGLFGHFNFGGNASFGNVTLNSVGGNDIFVARYDASGTLLWVRQFGSSRTGADTGGTESVRDVAVDGAGNSYVIGQFSGTVNFGSHTLSSPASNVDLFILKLDPAGNVVWAVQSVGSAAAFGQRIALSPDGEVATVSIFSGTITLGSQTFTASGTFDAVVAMHDPAGGFLWANQVTDADNQILLGVASFGGGVVVSGTFSTSATLDTVTVTSSGDEDLLLASYDAAGSLRWVKAVGASGRDDGRQVAIADDGDIIVTGFFGGTVMFDSISVNAGGPRAFLVGRLGTADEVIAVLIDIEPGSSTNPINSRSNGVVPVAILGTNDFDVTDVDVTTLAFGPAGATPTHAAGGHLEDVNGDSVMDLVSHYRQNETGLVEGDTEACVVGLTVNAVAIQGCDSVVVK